MAKSRNAIVTLVNKKTDLLVKTRDNYYIMDDETIGFLDQFIFHNSVGYELNGNQ